MGDVYKAGQPLYRRACMYKLVTCISHYQSSCASSACMPNQYVQLKLTSNLKNRTGATNLELGDTFFLSKYCNSLLLTYIDSM